MKKLNKKGFTLVELLAVIIILAIVVGISIPAITDIINESKNNALGVKVEAVADYLSDQFAIYNIDSSMADEVISDYIKDVGIGKVGGFYEREPKTLNALGFDINNVTSGYFCISTNGEAHVTVTDIPEKSEYYTTKYWTANKGVASIKKENGQYIEGIKNKAGKEIVYNGTC